MEMAKGLRRRGLNAEADRVVASVVAERAVNEMWQAMKAIRQRSAKTCVENQVSDEDLRQQRALLHGIRLGRGLDAGQQNCDAVLAELQYRRAWMHAFGEGQELPRTPLERDAEVAKAFGHTEEPHGQA